MESAGGEGSRVHWLEHNVYEIDQVPDFGGGQTSRDGERKALIVSNRRKNFRV